MTNRQKMLHVDIMSKNRISLNPAQTYFDNSGRRENSFVALTFVKQSFRRKGVNYTNTRS